MQYGLMPICRPTKSASVNRPLVIFSYFLDYSFIISLCKICILRVSKQNKKHENIFTNEQNGLLIY